MERLSNDDVGVAKGTIFQKIRPGRADFKTADLVKEKLGVGGGCGRTAF